MKVAVLTNNKDFEAEGHQFCELRLPQEEKDFSPENSVINYDIFVADINNITNINLLNRLRFSSGDLASRIKTFGVLIVFSGDDTLSYTTGAGAYCAENKYSWIPWFEEGLRSAKSPSNKVSVDYDTGDLDDPHGAYKHHFAYLAKLFCSDFYFDNIYGPNANAVYYPIYLDSGGRAVGILSMLDKWTSLVLILPKASDKNIVLKYILDILLPSISPHFISSSNIADPQAEWIGRIKLNIPGASAVYSKISDTEKAIAELNTKHKDLNTSFQDITKWADLLTKGSTDLEIRIGEALDFLLELGGKWVREPDEKDGPDITFEKNGKSILVECSGTEGLVKKNKGDQLIGWLSDPKYSENYDGILVGNPFAGEDISKRVKRDYIKNKGGREPLFSPDLIRLSRRRGFTVVWTKDLYELIIRKLRGESIDINNLLTALTTSGLQDLKGI